MEWFDNAIRSFFATIDSIVYSFLGTLYQLFMDLAHIDILSNETVSSFYSKIYVLLGLFMLVKVSFSFINYIVNPDSFLDKQKGAQKIFVNVILSLTMLTITPFAFSMLYKAQNAILDDNIIPRFFLGHTGDNVTNNEFVMNSDVCNAGTRATAASQGDYISILAFRPFYQPNTDIFSRESDSNYNFIMLIYCAEFESAKVSNYLVSAVYNAGGAAQQDENTSSDNSTAYYIDYKVFISTATGIFICFLLISFCFDIAVRSIKLGFLELVAPVPIISYIDPKSGKDGMFGKWLKELGRTWADLFIRLASVFLAIFVISLVANNDINMDGAISHKFWIELFVIIGALMFAKKLPELIEKVFGFKLAGSIQLNPFKKIQDQALFGKQVLGVGAGVAAAGLAGTTNFATRLPAVFNRNNWRDKDTGKLTLGRGLSRIGLVAGSTIAGATSAGRRAFMGASKDGHVASSISKAHKEAMFAKQQREDLGRQGSTMLGRVSADVARNLGVFNQAQRDTLRFAEEEQQIQIAENKLQNDKNRQMSGYQEYSAIVDKMKDKVDKDSTVTNLKNLKDAMVQDDKYYEYEIKTKTRMNNGITETYQEKTLKRDANGDLVKTKEAQDLEDNLKLARQASINKLLDTANGGANKDSAMAQWQKRLESIVETNNMDRSIYTTEGVTKDDNGNITGVDTDAKKVADTQVATIEASFAEDEKALEARKKQLAVAKQSAEVRAAAADNKARPVTSGGQPEGWTPSPSLNNRVPLGGQYGTHMQDRFDDTH